MVPMAEQIWPGPAELAAALRQSWDLHTSDEPDAWTALNPSRGQCGASTLVANDWLGGEILLATVHVGDKQVGYHYSNRLPTGEVFDPTGDQFYTQEVVSDSIVAERTAVLPTHGAARYRLLSRRVMDLLC